MKQLKDMLSLILFLSLPIFCEAESYRQKEIYQAYISGNMNQWAAIVKEMEKDVNIRTVGQKLDLVEYYYGLSAYYLDQKNEKLARTIIAKAEILIDHLLKVAPQNATLNAFKGSFIGLKINLDRYKLFTLGSESLKYINKAYSLDHLSVQALTDKGNALFHAPKLFGGDKAEALVMFQKSVSQMEKTDRASDNWFYLNTLVLVAKTYMALNQPENASLIYKKALRIEPDFLWVKNKLYPELQKMK